MNAHTHAWIELVYHDDTEIKLFIAVLIEK